MTMKKHFLSFAAGVLAVAMAACGSDDSAEKLQAQAQRVDAELKSEVAAAPQLFAQASAQYADSAFTIRLALADSLMHVSDYSQAMVEYFLSDEIKARAGKDLDEVVNTLAHTKEPMRICLTDVYGTSKCYDLPAATLRTLYKTQRSQLQLPEVRSQVLEILAGRSFRFAQGGSVQKVDFALASSFATYTVVYDSPKAYSGLNVANLKARYLKMLKPMYAAYGPLAPAVVEMNRSLGIDGYRFILTTPSGDSELKATLPWKEILAD